MDNDTRVGLRLEVAATCEDDGPCLSDNLGSRRNGDRVRDIVYTRVEENDLAPSVLSGKDVNMATPASVLM